MSSGQFMYVRNLCGILSRPAIQFSSEDSFRSPRVEISEFKEHACARADVYEENLYRQRETRPRSSAITHCRIYSRLLGSSASASAAPHGTRPPALPTLCRPLSSPRSARSPSFSYRLF
ncbi:unnamed protein product [Nesidiocoris tenuis]|uniref:Uncharacterized protein n=1 Tax=Nesidiocoris tenuis TaxID=355587 RepID=A0A6H5H7C9_9HEMI|nr:unnamed protein product [Nesidiocoris tenuis]